MLDGYFNIGGGSPIELPSFTEPTSHLNLVGARDKGHCALHTNWNDSILDIPARDKSVKLWSASDQGREALSRSLSHIDSSQSGSSYTEKLSFIRAQDAAFILNVNKDTHGSFALISGNRQIHIHGLYDTQLKSSYLVWSLDKDRVDAIRHSDPLRFLVYRFPVLDGGRVVFVQAEAVCSKWWRWLKSHQSQLHCFNALEYKLYGHP
jgi:hypothetical protein